MRDLKRSTTNVLTVTMDGETFELYYRQPTTTETLAYNRNLYRFDLDGKTPTAPTMNYEVMVEAALSVITGWTEGAFGFDGKPISADPASPQYRADWPALLKDTETRMVLAVAAKVFGGALVEKAPPFRTS